MKYTPPERLVQLNEVLQYCATAIFSKPERYAINKERAKLLANNFEGIQNPKLEAKIQSTLQLIKKQGWKPEKPII